MLLLCGVWTNNGMPQMRLVQALIHINCYQRITPMMIRRYAMAAQHNNHSFYTFSHYMNNLLSSYMACNLKF